MRLLSYKRVYQNTHNTSHKVHTLNSKLNSHVKGSGTALASRRLRT